jgi:hypothetical protein
MSIYYPITLYICAMITGMVALYRLPIFSDDTAARICFGVSLGLFGSFVLSCFMVTR